MLLDFRGYRQELARLVVLMLIGCPFGYAATPPTKSTNSPTPPVNTPPSTPTTNDSTGSNGGTTAGAATKSTRAPLAFFETGVSLLNPYHVSTTAPISISPATSTDANAFLEFMYTNRAAWGERIQNAVEIQDGNEEKKIKPGRLWGKVWDVQAWTAYFFANGQAATANTIVGSGNFDAELSVGLPFHAYINPLDGSDFTISTVAGYSAVTDRSALSAHQSVFAGLAYDTALPDPLKSTDDDGKTRSIFIDFRLVGSSVDSIRYISASNTAIQTTHGTLPDYHWKWTEGFETELLYPINKESFVTFTGRIYPSMTPGLWSIQIGLSVSFSDLLKGFFK